MRVLIIVHLASEGPGTLGTYLESIGAEIVTVRLYAGDPLPAGADSFDAIISMGGPMNVYEEEKYPFLKDETDFLRKALEDDLPVMGVCLGAQMIAKAAGARVALAAAKEVGWHKIWLTDGAQTDSLFTGLPKTLEVLQWHSDMFHVPEGGVLLASSEVCPNQAFRYRNGYGLQFHVEVTADILADWFSGAPEKEAILARQKEVEGELNDQARKMYRNFVGLVK